MPVTVPQHSPSFCHQPPPVAMAVSDAALTVEPKSSHVSDPSLLPFIQPHFDPADHLNAVLPSLSTSRSRNGSDVPLSELSVQTQTLLSQLNAQTTRLSAVLTQMTDDILRSGARLAYEVEVLRGETAGLSEALTDGLRRDVEKFVPGGVKIEAPSSALPPSDKPDESTTRPSTAGADALQTSSRINAEPEYLNQLRTLTLVRSRLESVIKVFGEAMQWTLAPSEVSFASSLVSVSAPEHGSESQSREEKGREFAERLRNEIAELITGTDEGLEAAQTRIQALRELSQVWKDTAEERARTRFVDGLVKLAEDRHRQHKNTRNPPQKKAEAPKVEERTKALEKNGGGFLENLQRLRDNIYLG
ncbi:uncharacterized protein BKA78DRAFT_320406 [Phyllosticta capitalensis]|uniref:uncharacterized protein n=1 Tax=Phyllosticta capitalensis TaxID=121624 RepID=UPI003130C04B